jgi:SET domain-containing protein
VIKQSNSSASSDAAQIEPNHHYANLDDVVNHIPEHYQEIDVEQDEEAADKFKLEPQYSMVV